MRIRVVGCSGSVPGPASSGSCYLVEADDASGRTWRIVLDLGAGALGPLQRWCDPREVDAVALSHLHADHCADLAALHVYLSYHPEGSRGPIAVYGPFGTSSRVEQLRGATEPSPVLDIRVWQAGGEVSVGPLTIRAEAVEHHSPAYALRVSGPREDGGGGAVVAYSGDSDECEGLARIAEGADVFLCEASYLESHMAARGTHLTGRRAGTVAEAAGVSRLVLTHVPPWTDPNLALAEAESTFFGSIDGAHPGLSILL
ncbi:MAG: MBL fold metallo-hydrolase [Demequinaceae bacterium]|nr:MBL fold metallo-hydrolase [Demequinaceae bacterium]